MNCSLHNKAQQKTEDYRPDTQTDRDADRETDREKLFLNALNRWRFSGPDPPPIHRYSTFFHSLLYYLMRSGVDSNEYQSALDYLTRNEVIWSEPPWSEHSVKLCGVIRSCNTCTLYTCAGRRVYIGAVRRLSKQDFSGAVDSAAGHSPKNCRRPGSIVVQAGWLLRN